MVTPKKIVSIGEKTGNNLEQYILTRNLDLITQWQKKQGDRLGTYRTFRQINGESHEIITKLKGLPDMSVFKRMKSSVLSLMQPKMRIYKVTYVEERPISEGSEQKEVVKLPVPCYREFKFSDNFGVEVAPSPSDYLAYESTKPSFRNVGLNSFSMESMGADLGALQKEITAKIVLTFKSLKDVQAQPPGEPAPDKGGLRYLDLFAFPPNLMSGGSGGITETYNPKHYQIKVLIGWTAPTTEQLSQLNLSAKEIADVRQIENLNMLLCLGLADYDLAVKDNGVVTVTISYMSYIDTNLTNQGTTVFADNWEIDDTSDELKLKAVRSTSKAAGVSGNSQKISRLKRLVLNAHELLAPAGEIDDKTKGKILNNIKNDDFFWRCYAAAAGKNPEKAGINKVPAKSASRLLEPEGDAVMKWLRVRKNADRFIKIMKAKNADFKNQVFPSFMRELIIGYEGSGGSRALSLPAVAGAGTRLFRLHANTEEIKDAFGVVYNEVKDDPEGAAGVNERDDAITSHAATVKERSKRITIAHGGGTGAFNTPAEEAKEASDLAKKTPEERAKAIKDNATPLDNIEQGHDFYFVFLGDLVELAARNAGVQQIKYTGADKHKPWIYHPIGYTDSDFDSVDFPLMNFRLLFGPLEFYDLNSQIKTINLAQFPISFNLFRAWFLDKIVDQNQTSMTLHSFIRSLVERLVMPSLGGAVPVKFKVKETKPSFHGLTLPGKQTDGPGIEDVCGRKGFRYEELLPRVPIMDIKGAVFDEGYYRKSMKLTNSEARLKTSMDYMLYQVTTRKHLQYRDGNPVEDQKDGILHFNIGSDVGMLKSMKFSQVKIPYRVEYLHEMATNQGLDQIEQLVYPYNTDVTLIGTPIFSPGMVYYINPSLAGLGNIRDSNSIAHKLNLGGYNFTSKVTMKIDSRGFVTKLSGEYQGHGNLGGAPTIN